MNINSTETTSINDSKQSAPDGGKDPDALLKEEVSKGIPISEIDKNGDGTISPEEWVHEIGNMGVTGIKGQFRDFLVGTLDSDKNEKLDANDIITSCKDVLKHGADSDELAKYLDRNNNGQFDSNDFVIAWTDFAKRIGAKVDPKKLEEYSQKMFEKPISLDEILNRKSNPNLASTELTGTERQ